MELEKQMVDVGVFLYNISSLAFELTTVEIMIVRPLRDARQLRLVALQSRSLPMRVTWYF